MRKDMDAVLSTLVDEQLGPNSSNAELSKMLCHDLSAQEALVLRSYPRALVIALHTLELPEHASVAISTLSPVWYVHILEQLGLKPVLVDVDPRTGCMSIESLRQQPQMPDALLLYQSLGNITSPEDVSDLQLPIIEDISQSFHTKTDSYAAGASGQIIILSFEDDAILAAGGGSAVLAKTKKYAASLKRNSPECLVYDLLPDVNSALIINQLANIDDMIAKRAAYFEVCHKSLMKTKHRVINDTSTAMHQNGYTFAVMLSSRVGEVQKYTRKYKIETTNPFEVCALTLYPERRTEFPGSLPFMLRAMIFPLYPLLSKEQLLTLARVLSTLP